MQCAHCKSFGCEVRAKSSTLATVIPEAQKTGRCEIRPDSYVRKIEVESNGRIPVSVILTKAAELSIFMLAIRPFVQRI